MYQWAKVSTQMGVCDEVDKSYNKYDGRSSGLSKRYAK